MAKRRIASYSVPAKVLQEDALLLPDMEIVDVQFLDDTINFTVTHEALPLVDVDKALPSIIVEFGIVDGYPKLLNWKIKT